LPALSCKSRLSNRHLYKTQQFPSICRPHTLSLPPNPTFSPLACSLPPSLSLSLSTTAPLHSSAATLSHPVSRTRAPAHSYSLPLPPCRSHMHLTNTHTHTHTHTHTSQEAIREVASPRASTPSMHSDPRDMSRPTDCRVPGTLCAKPRRLRVSLRHEA
jgi:hypothetical protein